MNLLSKAFWNRIHPTKLILMYVLLALPGTSFGEGSRTLYPASYPAGGARADLDFSGPDTHYVDAIKRETFLYAFVQAGEYIVLGSRNRSDGGNIFVYDPQSFGEKGDEDIPQIASFTCSGGSAQPGPHFFGGSKGSITSRNAELSGPHSANGSVTVTGGWTPCAYRAPVAGIYGIRFSGARSGARTPSGSISNPGIHRTTVSAWEVAVRSDVSSTTDLDGRVFTYAWVAFTGGNPRPIYSSLYYVSADGHRYEQLHNGLDPNGFALYANSAGFIDSGAPLYHDIRGGDASVSSMPRGISAQQAQYPIFFSSVDPQEPNETQVQLVLAALGIPFSAPSPGVTGLGFEGNVSGSTTTEGAGGNFVFTTSDTLTYKIVVSRSSDQSGDHPQNRLLTGTATTGTHSIIWDGRDNSGDVFPATAVYSYILEGRNGEIHFPIIDAEGNGDGGPIINKLYGTPRDSTVYFDDRGYTTRNGENIGTPGGLLCGSSLPTPPDPVSAVNGIDSSDSNINGSGHNYRHWPGHGNANNDCRSNAGFGDAKALDIWTLEATPALSGTLDIVQAGAGADVGVGLSVPPFAEPGQTVNGTLVFRNDGSLKALDVLYSFTLGTADNRPASINFPTLGGSDYSYNTATGTVTFQGLSTSLSAGQAHDLPFNYPSPGIGEVPVHAEISASNERLDDFSPNTADKKTLIVEADVYTMVEVPVSAPASSQVTGILIFGNSDAASTRAEGVTYTAVFGDSSFRPADVTFDELPAEAQATYQPSTGQVVFSGLPSTIDMDSDIRLEFSYTGPASGVVPVMTSITTTTHESPDVNNKATGETAFRVINHPPTAVNDLYTTPEDTPLDIQAPGILKNDTDPDGNELQPILVTPPAQGLLILEDDGSFSYTPTGGFSGRVSFTYKVSDGGLESGPATVTINVTPVNHPPVANNDTYTTQRNTYLHVPSPSVTGNDHDPDGNTLYWIPQTSTANGTLTVLSSGGLNYNPHQDFAGVDTFTYRAFDGELNSNIATVTIIVEATNRPPIAHADFYFMAKDAALQLTAPGIVANDLDPDGDALDAQDVSAPGHGTLVYTGGGGLLYFPAAGFTGIDSFQYRAFDGDLGSSPATVTINVIDTNQAPLAGDDMYSTPRDTVLQVSPIGVLDNDLDPDGNPIIPVVVNGPANGTLALTGGGGFLYAPNTGFAGLDSFTYKVNDGHLDSNVATVVINVNATNRAPLAGDDIYGTARDVPLNVPSPGVLTNDLDPDGDTLIVLVVGQPSHGTLALIPGGGFSYLPAAGYAGLDSFTYQVSDGHLSSNVATVVISITPTNRPPLAHPDVYSLPRDTVLQIPPDGILANDSDPDGTPVAPLLVSSTTHGALALTGAGGFLYAPATGWSGTDTFSYQVTDGVLLSPVVTVTLIVNAVNQAPLAGDDSYSTPRDTTLQVPPAGILGNDLDPDGDPIIPVVVLGPSNGTLALTGGGGFLYAPNTGFAGLDSFTYKVTDGHLDSNVATVVINVNATNRAPLAVGDSYSTARNVLLNVASPGILVNDIDPDGDILYVLVVNQPTNGTLALIPGGGFSYAPDTDFAGLDNFTYQVSDGHLISNEVSVVLDVTPTNRAPIATPDLYSMDQNSTLQVDPPGVLINDSDPDGNPIAAILVTPTSNGSIHPGNSGSFTYWPNYGFSGTDTFEYRVTDGQLQSLVVTVTIEVRATVQYVPVPSLNTLGVTLYVLLFAGFGVFHLRRRRFTPNQEIILPK